MLDKRKIIFVTPEEDAKITAAALADPDAQPLTDEQLEQMVPWKEFIKTHGVPVSTRFDRDLVHAFVSTGEGWQQRMNAALREWAIEHGMLPPA
ncbi:MAG TPA: BrnA antitoxin family protein [Burkholderiaceae bacterium]|nr:BrnA antitoxin family protein [Burkholderiaceae bacterium]